MSVKMLLKNQRGIIHLGVLGILVLAGGLFVASKLASNPDLTFFNIAGQAKGLAQDVCKKCFKSEDKKKTKKLTAADLTRCNEDWECTKNSIRGLTACSKKGEIYYCREGLKKCTTAGCSDQSISRATKCDNNGKTQYCCPKNEIAREDIGSCSKLAGRPPKCAPNAVCSSDPTKGSLCVTREYPDGGVYCPQ